MVSMWCQRGNWLCSSLSKWKGVWHWHGADVETDWVGDEECDIDMEVDCAADWVGNEVYGDDVEANYVDDWVYG